eukprot:3931035-Alexandrium_andersonii.AAC.1
MSPRANTMCLKEVLHAATQRARLHVGRTVKDEVQQQCAAHAREVAQRCFSTPPHLKAYSCRAPVALAKRRPKGEASRLSEAPSASTLKACSQMLVPELKWPRLSAINPLNDSDAVE